MIYKLRTIFRGKSAIRKAEAFHDNARMFGFEGDMRSLPVDKDNVEAVEATGTKKQIGLLQWLAEQMRNSQDRGIDN